MSDPTDPTAPDVPPGDADPPVEPVPVPETDPEKEPVARIPEGPLDEESHIGEPLPDDEAETDRDGDGLTDDTPTEGEEE